MFDIEKFRTYCLKKKGVTEEFPFDNETLVFKVMGKMFALTGLNHSPFTMNLKCDPERIEEIRASYTAVQPGYHMNKQHWNTVTVDGTIPQKELLEMIDHSYNEVVKGMTRKLRDQLNDL